MKHTLPMTREEAHGQDLDVVLVTGDAYVDHPGWGVSAIGRWLQDHGFSVGIISQPDWNDPKAFQVLGRPRLFMGITAGNMDTMVNRFGPLPPERVVHFLQPTSQGGTILSKNIVK